MKEILLTLIIASVFVACIVAFTLLLMHKLGIIEYLQVHGDEIISKMAHCKFCMSFWLSVLYMMVIVAFTDDVEMMVIPIISTPIARMLAA